MAVPGADVIAVAVGDQGIGDAAYEGWKDFQGKALACLAKGGDGKDDSGEQGNVNSAVLLALEGLEEQEVDSDGGLKLAGASDVTGASTGVLQVSNGLQAGAIANKGKSSPNGDSSEGFESASGDGKIKGGLEIAAGRDGERWRDLCKRPCVT